MPPKVQPSTGATAAGPAPAAATTGKKKPAARRKSNESTKSRKTSTGPKASTIAAAAAAQVGQVVTVVQAPAPAPKPVIEEPPREYEMFMEMLDHSIDYDWPSIGQLLGNKNDLNISEEERILLYGDPSLSVVNERKMPTPVKDTDMEGTDDQSSDKQGSSDKSTSPETVLPRPGWGRTNVCTVRAAWARVRLREKRERDRAKQSSAPVVAGGLLTLPGSAETPESKPVVIISNNRIIT